MRAMRKIEQQMVEAIRDDRNWTGRNTCVHVHTVTDRYTQINVTLHGNHIAVIHKRNGQVYSAQYASAGWLTVTTKSRLNALSDAFGLPHVRQRKGVWYIWESGWESGDKFVEGMTLYSEYY